MFILDVKVDWLRLCEAVSAADAFAAETLAVSVTVAGVPDAVELTEQPLAQPFVVSQIPREWP